VDIEYELRGIPFRWNADKAKRNLTKHGISFERAAEIFFVHSCDIRTLPANANNAMEPSAATSKCACFM
jgi:uncharacterized DUF497 family protein